MGHFIIKADRERDLYMDWSTIVDLPTFIGTRAETLDYLRMLPRQEAGVAEARVQRADETGTSARHNPHSSYTGTLIGAWDDTGFVVEQRGWLPRARLARFLDMYRDDPGMAHDLLLDPFPFEED